jgi:uncharacterized protein YecT (DUF1311 family)
LVLSQIYALQRNAKKDDLEMVASMDCINQKKSELEQKLSANYAQIKQVDKEINKAYSEDPELSNLQKQQKACQYRGLFPLSLMFK